MSYENIKKSSAVKHFNIDLVLCSILHIIPLWKQYNLIDLYISILIVCGIILMLKLVRKIRDVDLYYLPGLTVHNILCAFHLSVETLL